MKLIDNASQAWRLWSVRMSVAGASAAAVWMTMTDAQRQSIIDMVGLPPDLLVLLTFLATMASRVVKQEAVVSKGGGSGGDEDPGR